MELHDYLDRISQDPQVLVGKPVVKGTRVSVERVLEQLTGFPDLDELFAAFPHLTVEDVQACLAYAYDLVVKERDRAVARHPALATSDPACLTVDHAFPGTFM